MTNAITRFFSYIIIVIWLCIPIVAETEDFLCLDKPQRIAVFSLDAEEILLSLVPCERIAYVGHAYFDDGGLYSPTMYLTIDMPGEKWQNSDEEFLLGLDLDLLILPDDLAYYYGNGLFDDLYVSNVPVLFIKAPNTIDDIRSNIFIIGEAVCEPDNAQKLVHDFDAKINDYTLNEAYDSVKVLYYDHWQESFRIVSRFFGVQNLYESYDHVAYVDLDVQEIEAWNPDIILYNPVLLDTDGSILGLGKEYDHAIALSIIGDPVLSNTNAVRNNQIYPMVLHGSQYLVENISEFSLILQKLQSAEPGGR